jgi:hypothetical protein
VKRFIKLTSVSTDSILFYNLDKIDTIKILDINPGDTVTAIVSFSWDDPEVYLKREDCTYRISYDDYKAYILMG